MAAAIVPTSASGSPAALRRAWRLVAGSLVAAILALACAQALLFGGGETVTWRGEGAAPAWAGACEGATRRPHPLEARCARVTGRVLYVQRERADGALVDVHLAVATRWRVLVVKLRPERFATPGLGRRVSFVGPLYRVDHDLLEIDAIAVGETSSGRRERLVPAAEPICGARACGS